MPGQPNPQNRPNVPARPRPAGDKRPERIARNFGPINQRTGGRNWLPILFWGGIASALVCAIAFVLYSFFFFKPSIPESETVAEAMPTPEVVKFKQGEVEVPNSAPGEEVSGQPASQSEAGSDQPGDPAANPGEAETGQTDSPPASNEPTQPAAETPPPNPEQSVPSSADQPDLSVSLDKMKSPDFGIQAFLYWRSEVAERDLQLINDIKFRWVKQQFSWRDIEGAGKGVYDWASADRMMDQIDHHGLNVIARVDLQPEWAGGGFPEIGPPDDYQDYVDFVSALAARYKGRIDAYQIWNEPNLAREWGNRPPNPAEYAELLRRSYEAIKAVDPEAIVISAGLAPTTRFDDVAMPDTVFVQGMYDAGAQPYFDALGVHGAGYKVHPATDPEVVANDPVLNNNDPSPPEMKRIYAFRHVEDIRQVMVQNGDTDKRVVVLEFGWTVDPRPDSPYHWHAVTELEQAQYIIGAYRYAEQNWQPWIGVMSLIYLANVDWTEDDEQTYWSITQPEYPDFKARAAYWGLLEFSRNR